MLYGYIKENYQAIVDGITNAIIRAHNNLTPGYIEYNNGLCTGTSINRSPEAYLKNPKTERDKYKYDVDKKMHLLNFKDSNGNLLGVLNWCSVHATSMGKENHLIHNYDNSM